MKNIENELVLRLAECLKKQDIQKDQLNQLTSESNRARFEASLYSAMLSDICQSLYGGNANGSPMLLCHVHGSWVCGPLSKPENITFVEWVYKCRKEIPSTEIKKQIDEWKLFIKTLKSEYKRAS